MPRKGSRKVSVKARKGSKKASRGASKSRKGSKGSRKSSRKGSRKLSRHRSMSREAGEERGNVEYLHKQSSTDVKDGVVSVFEEYIVKGDKGLTFKLYIKTDKSKTKLVGRMNDDGSFSIKMMDGDKVDEKTMSKDEVLKMAAKDKNLKFVHDYLKSMKGGKRKASKKASKKSSKKVSKKGSKKRSSMKW